MNRPQRPHERPVPSTWRPWSHWRGWRSLCRSWRCCNVTAREWAAHIVWRDDTARCSVQCQLPQVRPVASSDGTARRHGSGPFPMSGSRMRGGLQGCDATILVSLMFICHIRACCVKSCIHGVHITSPRCSCTAYIRDSRRAALHNERV